MSTEFATDLDGYKRLPNYQKIPELLLKDGFLGKFKVTDDDDDDNNNNNKNNNKYNNNCGYHVIDQSKSILCTAEISVTLLKRFMSF